MKIDEEKVDNVVLALLQLTAHSHFGEMRAWKGQDWDVLDRLHAKGMIENPRGKAKSVVFTPEGLKRSEELFAEWFVVPGEPPVPTDRATPAGPSQGAE